MVVSRQLGVVQKPVTHGVLRRSMKTVQVARYLAPPPDAKRPLRASSCQKNGSLMHDAQSGVLSENYYDLEESRGAGTSGGATSGPSRWQR